MRKGAIHIYKWLGVAIALLFGAEIGLRLVFGLGYPVLIRPDPTYGYMPAPNQDLHRFFSYIHINAYGMRSEDIEANKPPGTRRILFVGDSVLFGTTLVDQQRIFTNRIQSDLANAAPETQVLNASAGGWAPSNELKFLEARGTFGADLIVFVLNTRDVTQSFQAFENNASNPTHNPPTAIADLFERYIAPRIFEHFAVHDPGSVGRSDPAVETDTPKILATLSQAHRIALDHHARFAIIFTPAIDEGVTAYQQHWDKGVSMLLDWAKREDISVLDMRQDFAQHASKEVFLDGIHLKPFGHELIEKAFIEKYREGQL